MNGETKLSVREYKQLDLLDSTVSCLIPITFSFNHFCFFCFQWSTIELF